MKPVKATGKRGSWFALVEDEWLPCVHKHWLKGLNYHDPLLRHEGSVAPKIAELVDSIRETKKVVLTEDKVSMTGDGSVVGFDRSAYIAVFAVDDVSYSFDDGLKFRLTERIHNLI
ncbi:MAG: hypothetical protein IBJ07_05790 [Rhizobiaceae bacterium]|nr:hypothetical protein [Rhizobiaceae bacterium]